MGFEDLGFAFDIDFSEMELEDEEDKRVLVRAEEASVNTMGTAFGGQSPPDEDTQQTALAGHAGEGAAPLGSSAVAN